MLSETLGGEEGSLPWCPRGYPFKCPFEEVIQFVGRDDANLLSALDDFCRNCPRRLDYERHHHGFTV
jgi:hypothetical protein